MRLLLVSLVALVLAGSALATTRLPGFVSPTHNIRCFRNAEPPGVLHCSIREAVYAKQLATYCGAEPIGVDWGGFELGPTRRGHITCTGGVLYDPSTQRLNNTILAYGKTWRSGPFTCRSALTGVTCESRSGHGLFVSRRSWRAW